MYLYHYEDNNHTLDKINKEIMSKVSNVLIHPENK